MTLRTYGKPTDVHPERSGAFAHWLNHLRCAGKYGFDKAVDQLCLWMFGIQYDEYDAKARERHVNRFHY